MEGWVKLHRCLIDKPIFDNANLLKVWIWCLCKATHKQHTQVVGLKKVELNVGEFITGRNAGALELKLKPSTFWDYMQFLKDNQSIDINSNNKYSVITVENWESYQVDEDISDNKTNSKPTAKQQQTDTNKNEKNEKKTKYGEFENVLLTEKEYDKLIKDFGVDTFNKIIDYFSPYIVEKKYKSASHNLAIRRWVVDAVNKKPSYSNKQPVREEYPEL